MCPGSLTRCIPAADFEIVYPYHTHLTGINSADVFYFTRAGFMIQQTIWQDFKIEETVVDGCDHGDA
ncbi:MAG: hypothetical protein CSA22_06300 [Deltaproteobacteria bacterium]|nr:MAG: hypothetical protein CSA22_06300 [Deltaproteobacteria bacterium]